MSQEIPIRFIQRKRGQLRRHCSAVKIDRAEGVCIAPRCPRGQQLIETGICPAEVDWWNEGRQINRN